MPKENIKKFERENKENQETEPNLIEQENKENIISEDEKLRRKEVLEKIAEEATNEEDDKIMMEEKESVGDFIQKSRSKFPLSNDQQIIETLGERILDEKEKIGLRKTLEKVLEIDPALFDELKDWCVNHYDELLEQGLIIESK